MPRTCKIHLLPSLRVVTDYFISCNPDNCFYGYIETKDGRYFSVGSIEPPFLKLLCEAIGREDLMVLSMSYKLEDDVLFKEAVREAFLSKTFAEWQTVLADIEACVEPVFTCAEACEHPQIVERGMLVEVANQNGGYQKQIACPIKSTVFTTAYKHAGAKSKEIPAGE